MLHLDDRGVEACRGQAPADVFDAEDAQADRARATTVTAITAHARHLI